jgi:hypothetical protein
LTGSFELHEASIFIGSDTTFSNFQRDRQMNENFESRMEADFIAVVNSHKPIPTSIFSLDCACLEAMIAKAVLFVRYFYFFECGFRQ